MKFHKLVRSIDYVTYPSYEELKKINKTLGDSYTSIQNILISAFIGFILDRTMVFKWIIESIIAFSENQELLLLSQNEDLNRIAAFVIAFLVYFILWFKRFADSRWGSNKDTVDERKSIVVAFYRRIVPNLIALKSIIQQNDESDKEDVDKRYLLLLQAHYEIIALFEELDKINVIEFQKDGTMHDDSKDVLEQIGVDAYLTVLKDLLTNTKAVFIRITEFKENNVCETLDSLNSYVVGSNAISASKKLTMYSQAKKIKKLDDEIRNLYRNYSEGKNVMPNDY